MGRCGNTLNKKGKDNVRKEKVSSKKGAKTHEKVHQQWAPVGTRRRVAFDKKTELNWERDLPETTQRE